MLSLDWIDTAPESPQQGAWWWWISVIFSPILHRCQPEWAQARSELSLQHFQNLFCTCQSALYPKALSLFLICITSSILPMPFLLFRYPFLHSPPEIPYSVCLHSHFHLPLFSFLFKDSAWYSSSPLPQHLPTRQLPSSCDPCWF